MTRSGLVHSDRTDWDSQSTRLKEVFSAKEIKDYEKKILSGNITPEAAAEILINRTLFKN